MHSDQVRRLLEQVGAVRHGHFVLSSGRHSGTYVQCALVLAHPRHAEMLGRALGERFRGVRVDAVVSLALGGLIIGHEVARVLGVPAMFVERDAAAQMALRREFSLDPGERILLVEDVWTTGKSTREAARVVHEAGAEVAAFGAIVDRSGGQLQWPAPAHALMEISIPSYAADDCPLCRSGDAAVRPGSRFKRAAP